MINVTLSNQIVLSGYLPPQVEKVFRDSLTFANPKWITNNRYGYFNVNTPEKLTYFVKTEDGFRVPRGFFPQLIKILDFFHVPYETKDRTRLLPSVNFGFKGELRGYQIGAVNMILDKTSGVLEAPPASGKTVLALAVIAALRQPALVIVPTKELLYQWQDRAAQFLGLDKDEIGLLGDGKKVIGHRLSVGIVNSVLKMIDELKTRIGFLVVDECHRTPSRTFTEAVSTFDCRYVLGLSATPYRADGLTKLISFFIGEALYRIEPKTLQDQGAIMTARLIIRKTAFNFPYYHPEDYQPMLTGLTIDHNRNLLIVGDVLEASKNGAGISLILSDRKAHCRDLADMIQGHRETRLLTGDMKAEDRKQVVEELKKGKVKVLIATAQLIGEGFDLPALSNLFLTTPVKFEGRTKQYVGRILRTAQGKECPVVFDYLDRPGVLQVGFRARMKAYKEMGIELRKE